MSSSPPPPPNQSRINEVMRNLDELIDTHGWAIMFVAGRGLVAYTVGLSRTFGLPELVLSGLDADISHELLNSVAVRLTQGTLALKEGALYDEVFEGFFARFRKLSTAEVSELRMALALAPDGAELTAWQLHWPDPQGKFWDDPEVDPTYAGRQDISSMLADEVRTIH